MLPRLLPALIDSGKDLEDRPFWRDMPDMPPELEWVYKAYAELAGSRHTPGGPVPFEAADRYADRHGIDDFDSFWALIRAMDRAYQEHLDRERGSGD